MRGWRTMTADLARKLRLNALFPRIEVDGLGIAEIGDDFRAVAAEVTMLERRADGRAPVNETILLAVDRRNRWTPVRQGA